MNETIETRCNQCIRETKHDVLHRLEKQIKNGPIRSISSEGGPAFSYRHTVTRYALLECRGCDEVAFEIQRQWDPDEFDLDRIGDDDEQPETFVEATHYPSPTYRQKPDWISNVVRRSDFESLRTLFAWKVGDEHDRSVPDEVLDLLDEVYQGLQAGCWRISVMGIRAILDVTLNDKVGDQGGFQEKLRSATDHGFISNRDAKSLNAAIQLGHAVAHRGHNPYEGDTIAALDIVENMLRAMYRTPGQAQSLSDRTPKRKEDK